MGIRFILRGTSLDAHFSYNGKTSGPFGNIADDPVVQANANAGVFGSSVINMVPASVTKGLIFPGFANVCAASNSGGFSVLARLVPTANAATFGGFGVIEVGSSRNPYGFAYRCGISAVGRAYVQLFDLAGNATTYTGSTVFSATANVPIEVMFTWNGQAAANAIKISRNGVEIESMTSTNTCTQRVQSVMSNIVVGSISAGPTATRANLNELIVWDTVENHVYSARTDFWSQAAFDGLNYTDPGVVNVKTGTAYSFAGTSLTGTYDGPVQPTYTDPGEANVKTGTAYTYNDLAKTGTYDGSDRHTDPGVSNVLMGVEYKSNSLTNNRTGTLDSISLNVTGAVVIGQTTIGTIQPGGAMNQLSFTKGDDVTLTIVAKNGSGAFINLTGATLTTYFPKANKQQLEIQNAAHTLANQTTNPGQFSIALTDTNTNDIMDGEGLNVLVKVEISGNVTYLHGHGILTVYKASTHR